MRDLLILVLIVSLAVWWAVKNPQTAQKMVGHIETAKAKVIAVVSDSDE